MPSSPNSSSKSGKARSRPAGAGAPRPSGSGAAKSREKKARAQAAGRAARRETANSEGGSARPSKAQQVYSELRGQILSGELEPGAAIDKLALCAKLKVSRFPVQAAINRLAFERLVTIAPQHGSFVAPMSHAAIREFHMIRRALECEIAEMAAPLLTRKDRDALTENLAHQAKADAAQDVSAFYHLDVAFHHLIARPLALTHILDTLRSARTHLERVRRMVLSPQGRTGQAYDEHRALAAALCAGDGAAARRAMREHLDSASVANELIFSERPELFSP